MTTELCANKFNGVHTDVNNKARYSPQNIGKRHEKVRYETLQMVFSHIGHQAHSFSSFFSAKFSLLVTDHSKSAQLVIRYVGRFMSLLSHDLQSAML